MRDDTRALWAECLPEESDGFMNYYYTVKTRDNWIQQDEADGQLVSMIHWNPYRMYARGKIWDSRYIIAVATKKEYRRQGRMAKLLTEGMRKFAAEGMPFVWLMPIAEGIYEPFDFRYVYEKCEGEWPEVEILNKKISSRTVMLTDIEDLKHHSKDEIGELHDGEVQTGKSIAVRVLCRDEYEEAAAFMNQELAKRYDVFTERTAEWLEAVEEEVASEDGHIWGIFENTKQDESRISEARGCAEEILKNAASETLVGVFHEWRGETIEIRELICKEKYEEGIGRATLIAAVSGALHKDDISLIREKNQEKEYAPEASPVKRRPITVITTGWLGDPKPIIMARIINVKEFVKVIKAKHSRSLILQIKDKLIPENHGVFRWTLTESGSLLERLEDGNPDTEKDSGELPELTLGITELTEWLFGRRQIPGYEDICTLDGVFLNEIV